MKFIPILCIFLVDDLGNNALANNVIVVDELQVSHNGVPKEVKPGPDFIAFDRKNQKIRTNPEMATQNLISSSNSSHEDRPEAVTCKEKLSNVCKSTIHPEKGNIK